MATVTLDTAQKQLPSLVKRALEGEDIVIEGPDASVVRLAPVASAAPSHLPASASHRGRGALKDKLVVGREFFDPLDDEACGYGSEAP